MTREETKAILAIITEVYPNFSPANMKTTIDLWATYLADDDVGMIKQALDNYIRSDTSGYAPNIGQLRQSAVPEIIDDTEEVIAKVRKAVANGYYNSQAEFDALPEGAKKAVGSPENLKAWAVQDIGEFESVTLSHVRRAYRTVLERKRSDAKLLPLTDENVARIQDSDRRLLFGE